jgi:DNA-binding GntR family transcriptional regulator
MEESTYEKLRNLIVSGELAPGVHLVETSLAETLGVSRTPIRESLSRLEQDGLVERGSRGLEVRRRSPAEILEIYEVRIVLEGMASQLAAERHSDVDRIRIAAELARLEASRKDDSQAFTANQNFHRAIWVSSHNRTLIDLLDRVSVHLFRYPFSTYQMVGRGEASLTEHKELADAIFRRDGELAARIASHHMIAARTIRLEMWEQNPGLLEEAASGAVAG